jgi:hypothetical protein
VLPIVVITHAWLAAHNFTYEEVGALLDIDLDKALPATDGRRCPKCGRQPADTAIRLFVPDSVPPMPAGAQQVSGRDNVVCVCGTAYWYATIHNHPQPRGRSSNGRGRSRGDRGVDASDRHAGDDGRRRCRSTFTMTLRRPTASP